MQNTLQGLKRSASLKALVIGVLILVLLIPVSMIKGVVHDRNNVRSDARYDIMRSWGGEQILAGPVLVVPYRLTSTLKNGNVHVEHGQAFVLPTELDIVTRVDPEIRYRGLHKVPIYRASLDISGTFEPPNVESLGIRGAEFDWQLSKVALSVSEARAIAETPSIEIDDKATRFGPGGQLIFADRPPAIVAVVGPLFDSIVPAQSAAFSMRLELKGVDSLRFTPLGDTTDVAMQSDWESPSFVGNYLPETRDISDGGFGANWQVSSIGRALPGQWTSRDHGAQQHAPASFGVLFYMPVSLYQLTLRASKYAILFIGLSFVAYFLFEILAKLRLHPLQYLLVGFANALFYLLLLSLAEHINFGWAYLASAGGSTGLIAGYSAAVLGNRRRGLLMAAVLSGLYAFLYMTLKAESYALLAGALALWATLAVIMYLTRRIDWYAYGRSEAEN